MAKKRATSALAGKLNKKLGASLAQHAEDKTKQPVDFTNLPPGINGGIAELNAASLGTYKTGDNQGEPFIRLAGAVLEPKSVVVSEQVFVDGKVQLLPPREVRCAGLITSMMLPLCETTNSKGDTTSDDDNVAAAMNWLRVLGGDECTKGVEDEASLVALLEELAGAGIKFRFSTSAGTPTAQYPKSRTWENWAGPRGLEDYEPAAEEAVDDATGDAEPETDAEPADDVDLDALAKAADGGDDKAAEQLKALACTAGVDEPTVDDAEDWAAVAKMVEDASDSDSDSDSDDDEPDADEGWTKGDFAMFKPPKAKKARSYEVTAVFEKKGTCNLKSVADGTVLKGVKLDALASPE